MSGRNKKNRVIYAADSVRKNIELIDHISSANAEKLNLRFAKINDELEKLYKHQLKHKKKSLSDPIPEEGSIPDPIPESPIRRNSSSLEDDFFRSVASNVRGSKHVTGKAGKKKRSRKKTRKK